MVWAAAIASALLISSRPICMRTEPVLFLRCGSLMYRDQIRHAPGVANICSSVSEDYAAGLGRLRFDEIEREPLFQATEEGLALAQDDRVNNQAKLIDQVLVQKACDEGCSADDIYVFAWPALEGSEFRDVANDLRRGPRNALKRRRHNNVGCLGRQSPVRDFTLRRELILVWRDTIRIGVDRFPVLPVARVHVRSQDEGINIGDQLDCVRPRVCPVLFSILS